MRDNRTRGPAGTFTSDGTNAYWLDTAGFLWGVDLATGKWPLRWPDYKLNIPALLGGGAAFTNTELALVQRLNLATGQQETHLYLTLRNYAPPGSEALLRQQPTGSDGAVVAIGPDGSLK